MPSDEPAENARRSGRPRLYGEKILLVIDSRESMVTAQDLYLALRSRGVRAGLSTVYRELHRFVALGVLRELRLGDQSLYGLASAPRRDYAICDRCQRVVPLPTSWSAALQHAESRGLLDLGSPIVIHGRCVECSTRQTETITASGEHASPRGRIHNGC